jgi:hypothetical protein
MNKRTLVIGGIILAAALSRLIPHPLNFAPLGAMSLFGAAYLSDKKFAFIFPLVAYFLTDLFINNVIYGAYYGGFTLFTPGFGWIYGSIAAIVLIGFVVLKKVSLPRVFGASILSSVAFFVISNFGVWLADPDYPINAAGFVLCYEMALPFFKNTVLGDFAYSAILFGGFEFALSRTPELQKA